MKVVIFFICFSLLSTQLACTNTKKTRRGSGQNSGFCASHAGASSYNEIGNGTAGSPYLICTEAQLDDIGASGCNGLTSTACGDHFKLAGNISIAGPVTPIGSSVNKFSGVFDGDNHTLSNLAVNPADDASDVGLFSVTASPAEIKNLTLANASLIANGPTLTTNLGILAGTFEGSIDNVTANYDIEVHGTFSGVGLVGYSPVSSSFENVSVGGTIHFFDTGDMVGGVVGRAENDLRIHNSSSTVTLKEDAGIDANLGYVGGMIGSSCSGSGTNQDFSNLTYNGTISADGGALYNIGGIAGAACDKDGTSTISNITASGTITLGDSADRVAFAFGYYGVAGAVLTNITASGTITVDDNSTNIGGVVGETTDVAGSINPFDISNSHSTVVINGGDSLSAVGTFAGSFWNQRIHIQNSYAVSTANLGEDTWTVGAFAGTVGGWPTTDLVVDNVYVTGSFNLGPHGGQVGGIAGLLAGIGTVTDSYSTVDFYGINANGAGGFAGDIVDTTNTLTVSNCYSTGDVLAPHAALGVWQSYTLGGFAAMVQGANVERSYSTGNIIGNSLIGSFVGYIQGGGKVENSYATGSISIEGDATDVPDRVGGFVGHMLNSTANNNYFTGAYSQNWAPVNTVDFVGILQGANTLNNNFWDQQTTGISGGGAGYTPKTTVQMKTQATFTGWDFTAGTGVWQISAGQYPALQ